MYWRKIYLFSMGRHMSPAVAARLKKKKKGYATLHLLLLSILVISVLKADFPSFSARSRNLLIIKARKNRGMMMAVTKKAYEKKVITFRILVVFLLWSSIFMIEKNVKSKNASM